METQLNLTKTERLTLWNQKRFEAFLPTTIFLNFCAVVGLFGNGVVIYIYGLRLHAKNAGRYFIPYLAVADLLALVISAELHTVSNSTPVTYTFETFCKWNFVAALFVTVFSISILLIIAVQRYLKVCKPFGGQMTLFWRRFSLCLTFILTAGLVVPTYFTFGLENVYNKELNVTGTACRRLTSTTQTLSLIHSATCTLLILIGGLILIVLYTMVAKVIYRQNKQNLGDANKKKTNISRMFIIITIIFFVSFLPRMITNILEGIIVGMWEALTIEEYAIVRFFELMYVVNHMANPLVYAFLDKKFVTEFKKAFCCKTVDSFQKEFSSGTKASVSNMMTLEME